MKTYAEKMNKKPFDWVAYLNRQIKEKRNVEKEENNRNSPWWEEYKKIIKLSGSWVTCACGNQCSILDRNNADEPEDHELYSLGVEFNDVIEIGEWQEAKKVLAMIEKRSAKLIQEKIKNSIEILESFGYKLTKTKTK